MAGGIPKVKAFLAIANRIYKGRGERFMSSRALLDSDLGKLILMNFDEVTANGYHGTEILIGGEYHWQTYTNYTQGYAKMRLESVAQAAWADGISATVF